MQRLRHLGAMTRFDRECVSTRDHRRDGIEICIAVTQYVQSLVQVSAIATLIEGIFDLDQR